MAGDTSQRLTTALLREGTGKLAQLWQCSVAEASRRINDDRGMRLSEIARTFDALGIQIVSPDEDVLLIPRDEIRALNLLAGRYLARRNGEE